MLKYRLCLQEQRGSISPVFVTLLAAVMLLFYAILEREWANYNQEMAIQTADFAAQVAGRAHIAYATIQVSRLKYETVSYQECEADPITGLCTWRTRYRTESRWSHPTKKVPVSQLMEMGETWIALFDCKREASYDSDSLWQYRGHQVRSESLEFLPVASEVARTTFLSNWPGHEAAEAIVGENDIITDGATRKVNVVVHLRVRSLLGILPWERERVVYGTAVTVVPKVAEFLN